MALVGFPGGEELPVFFELERGGERGDLAAFRKKLPFLRSLMADTRLETALGVSTGVRIVVVFKDADMRQAALAQWPEPDAGVWGSFFIKALPELVPDFDDDWWHPNIATADVRFSKA